MDLLTHYILPFVIVLTILVFVHELGHYLVARWNGVKVDVFSIGFGPELFGWTDKAQTRWKVSLLPLGGYVKMYGDANAASTPDQAEMHKMSERDRALTLHGKTVWQRIAVSAAGPLANYLFAFLVFSFLFATVGERYTPAEIGFIQEGSAAQKAGLLIGDRIVSVEDLPIQRFEDMQLIISENPGVPLSMTLMRGEDEVSLNVTPDTKEVKGLFGKKQEVGVLGIGRQGVEYIQRNPLEAVFYAAKECFTLTMQTLKSIGQMILGTRSAEELGGPLRIAQLAGEVAQAGLPTFLWFIGILSVSLGFINLLPIPLLDGGHLLFYGIEVIRGGKPLSEKAQEKGFYIGFLIVGSLMIFSFWNDLVHLKVVEKIINLF
ncbi:MAG: RIP metalloprotease RseP [Proteobacteria bacterium]|nr:RIP metalloprotease RseP [Pseudomonadota bacterium]